MSELSRNGNLSSSEIWKDVKGYEGLYQVSTLGRIRSVERLKIDTVGRKRVYPSTMLMPIVAHHGYLRVNLYKHSKIKVFFIHRLVAINFMERPSLKHEVNHLNGIKSDNSLDNLEWVTPSENHIHAFKTGLKKGRSGSECNLAKLSAKQVNEIRRSRKLYRKIAKQYNTSISNISLIKNLKTWSQL